MTGRLAFALVAAHTVFAATPVITELRPRGAEIGRPFTLTAMGRKLGEGAKGTSTMAASFTAVIAQQVMGGISFLVEPKADAVPGIYPVRIETPSGISNVLLFTLGSFPEVTEEESRPGATPHSNDSI